MVHAALKMLLICSIFVSVKMAAPRHPRFPLSGRLKLPENFPTYLKRYFKNLKENEMPISNSRYSQALPEYEPVYKQGFLARSPQSKEDEISALLPFILSDNSQSTPDDYSYDYTIKNRDVPFYDVDQWYDDLQTDYENVNLPSDYKDLQTGYRNMLLPYEHKDRNAGHGNMRLPNAVKYPDHDFENLNLLNEHKGSQIYGNLQVPKEVEPNSGINPLSNGYENLQTGNGAFQLPKDLHRAYSDYSTMYKNAPKYPDSRFNLKSQPQKGLEKNRNNQEAAMFQLFLDHLAGRYSLEDLEALERQSAMDADSENQLRSLLKTGKKETEKRLRNVKGEEKQNEKKRLGQAEEAMIMPAAPARRPVWAENLNVKRERGSLSKNSKELEMPEKTERKSMARNEEQNNNKNFSKPRVDLIDTKFYSTFNRNKKYFDGQFENKTTPSVDDSHESGDEEDLIKLKNVKEPKPDNVKFRNYYKIENKLHKTQTKLRNNTREKKHNTPADLKSNKANDIKSENQREQNGKSQTNQKNILKSRGNQENNLKIHKNQQNFLKNQNAITTTPMPEYINDAYTGLLEYLDHERRLRQVLDEEEIERLNKRKRNLLQQVDNDEQSGQFIEKELLHLKHH